MGGESIPFPLLPDCRAASSLRRGFGLWRPLHNSSSPRRGTGGFTFEVQQMVPEYFGRSVVVETLSWRVVVRLDELSKAFSGKSSQVGLAWKGASESSDGVFDTTFLPRRVSVAEEGLNAERMELVMFGELSAVVEGEGLSPMRWKRSENGRDWRRRWERRLCRVV